MRTQVCHTRAPEGVAALDYAIDEQHIIGGTPWRRLPCRGGQSPPTARRSTTSHRQHHSIDPDALTSELHRLLAFGRRFPDPRGGAVWLGMQVRASRRSKLSREWTGRCRSTSQASCSYPGSEAAGSWHRGDFAAVPRRITCPMLAAGQGGDLPI